MTQEVTPATTPSAARTVTVRYWAAARAAAERESDVVPWRPGMQLSDVLDVVLGLHGQRPRLREVVAICAVLVGDRPVGMRPHEEVPVDAGDTVELLPPFAGG